MKNPTSPRQEVCPLSLDKVDGWILWYLQSVSFSLGRDQSSVIFNKMVNRIVGSNGKVSSQGQFNPLKSSYCVDFVWNKVCFHILRVYLNVYVVED